METAMNATALADVSAKLDAQVRKLLSQRIILAHIMKYTVRECAGMELDEIVDAIEGEPEVHSHPVYSGHRRKSASEITGMANESADPEEGVVRYDILFYAMLPYDGHDKKKLTKVILNVEAQKDFYPGYPIETRAVFYAAREISAQKNTEFKNSDYEKIKKCYSIWICMQAPDRIGNAIAEYTLQKRDLVSGIPDRKEAYDKISIVLIALNEGQESKDSLTSLLNTLLSRELTVEEKKRRVEHDYDITVEGDLEEGMNSMCNYSEMILEKGLEKGLRKGRAEGLAEGCERGRTEGRAEGRAEGRILTYAEIGMGSDEIARRMQIPVSEVIRVIKENELIATV